MSSFLFIFALSIVAACGNSEEKKGSLSSTQKNELTMSWVKDIGQVNPHMYSPNELFAQAMLYDPLVSYGEDGEIKPALATSWEMAADGKSYTFTLRDNVLYSDGTKLTAENVKRNIDTVVENSAAHSWLEVVAVIDSVEAVGEAQVKINLKEPYYPFLQELTLIRPLRMLANSGFPASGTTKDGIEKPIGTGPWILTDYEQDSFAEFTRNDNYWGEKPKLKKVIVKIIPDAQARMMALEKGDIDLIFGSGQLAPAEYQALQKTGKYQTMISEPSSTRILSLNTTYGVTQDKNVRLALQHALDRQTIIDHILNGLEQEAHTLFAPGFPFSDIKLEPYSYNVEKAVQLLDEAGWTLESGATFRTKNGQTLTIVMPYNSGDQVHKGIFEYLQSAWREIGVEVKLIGEEDQFFKLRSKTGEYNVIMNDTWGVPYDPHMYIRMMIGDKQIGYFAQKGLTVSDQLTAEIATVIRSTDEVERRALYESILQTIHEEAIFMPLSYRTNYLVANKRLSNMAFSMQQYEVPLQNYEVK
ncbi:MULTISPECIES: nickel ABC transporter substrate-binding protein [unclassified Lysinibacillus]|uniref:nickel ABC transporter substrate-binding protein n=1 Tax=unclassified Lysinibacillus TaxID=2636778 RepID=UPI00380622A2